MRTSNPTLREGVFTQTYPDTATEVMTINGTVNKSFILVTLLLIPASFVWTQYFNDQHSPLIMPLFFAGMIGSLILALVTVFKPSWSPVTAPVYALFEGLFLGGISAFFERSYPNIVMEAVALTFGTFICLLLAYRFGWIRATENFRLGVFAATAAIGLIYLAGFILRFFDIQIPYIHESGPIGIGFSIVVVVIAALNLVLDFDYIEEGSRRGAPKYMEWYAAFGLLVTLVWLYIEILRLLSKLKSRD